MDSWDNRTRPAAGEENQLSEAELEKVSGGIEPIVGPPTPVNDKENEAGIVHPPQPVPIGFPPPANS